MVPRQHPEQPRAHGPVQTSHSGNDNPARKHEVHNVFRFTSLYRRTRSTTTAVPSHPHHLRSARPAPACFPGSTSATSSWFVTALRCQPSTSSVILPDDTNSLTLSLNPAAHCAEPEQSSSCPPASFLSLTDCSFFFPLVVFSCFHNHIFFLIVFYWIYYTIFRSKFYNFVFF